jgi:hypothetical protein
MTNLSKTSGILGPIAFLDGAVLRRYTHAINWPTGSWPYLGGDISTSSWAIAERADIDVSRFLMALGILLLAIFFLKAHPNLRP